MGILKPTYAVKSNCPLELNRDNPFEWTYSEPGSPFADGTTGYLTFKNTYGQTVATWEGDTVGGDLHFLEETDAANAIPAGTSWTLTVDLNDGSSPRLKQQGAVIRAEAPFPNQPAQVPNTSPVQFNYSFATPGFLVDPAWRPIHGTPKVYNNSGSSLPNAVAGGTLFDGQILPNVLMLYYAPLNTDNVRLTYNTVSSGKGTAGVIICSAYDATNYACFLHAQGNGFWGSTDTIAIATGNGDTNNIHVSAEHNTTHENFTAAYDAASNTFALYLGTSGTPLLSWTDSTNIVSHGPGERYVGFSFQSGLTTPGVEICDWFVADDIAIS